MRNCLALVSLFILFYGVLNAQRNDQVTVDPEDRTPIQFPKLITGKIVDQNDVAVRGATVNLAMTAMSDTGQDWSKLFDVNVTTDDKGEFKLEIDKTPPDDWELYLDVAVGSKIHFTKQFRFFDKTLRLETADLGALKVSTGIRVKGRLQSPDSGVDAEAPVVNVSASMSTGYFFYRYLNCDAEGHFECVVPAGCKLNLSIGAENFACSNSTHTIESTEIGEGSEIPEFDLGKLFLKRGVSVVGSAKRVDGSPAAGIVIGIIEGPDRKGEDIAEHVSSAKTDAKGNFRLPPHLGKCTLVALKGCRTRAVVNGDSKMIFSDGEVPYFHPVDLDLDGKGPELTVKMVASGSITISGAVYDANGKPMVGQQLIYSWPTRFGVINQERTKTDGDGKYSFPFGKGRKLSIRLYDDDLTNNGFDFFITKDAAFRYEDLFPDRSSRLVDELEFMAIEHDVDELDYEVRQTGPLGGLSWLDRTGEFISWWLFGEH